MGDPAGVTGLVVAAGTGRRFGGQAKAFALLAGEPLVVHAVRALVGSGVVGEVVVVVAPAATERADAALDAAGLPVRAVVAGGATRQESVRLGLERCPAGTRAVAVHDAARPLASPDLVAGTVAALAGGWAAVAPGLPVVDTLKRVEPTSGKVLATLDREGVWAVQTPQVCDALLLRKVHGRHAGGQAVTDDLSLVERAGGRVRLVEGEAGNLKVTFPHDLVLAEALLAASRARP